MSRKGRFERWLDGVAEKLADPELWKAAGIFAALLAVAIAFFWVAAGFDALARRTGSVGVGCRAQGNAQALTLFVSPFVIGLSCMAAAGEFFSQMEERRRYKRPLRWGKITLSFGLAAGFLILFGALMVIWC